MKSLGVAGIALAALAAIFVIIVLAQPTQGHIEKSIVIVAPASAINDEIDRFQSFDAWSPWSKVSPEKKYTIVSFAGFDGTFYSGIRLDTAAKGTKVTWVYDGINDGFKGKAMWILMKGRMEDQYDKGLIALKKLIETRVTADTTKVK
jgi:hypothetical protein